MLLTDGQANVGVVDHPTLTSMARQAAGDGIGTTTIGFGDGFDEDLLTSMAEAGQRRSYYAGTPDAAPGIFAEEFEGLMSVVAQNLSVEIRPAEQVQVLGILNDFPQLGVPGGVQVQLGDAFAGERRRVLFELHVPDLAALGPARIADVVIRHTSVTGQVAMHQVTVPLLVNLVSADEAAAAVPDGEVVEEVVVLRAARAQREAVRLADEGDFPAARKVLEESARELQERAPTSAKAAELLEQAEVLDRVSDLMAPASYQPSVRKAMHYESYQRRQRRTR